MGQITFTDKEFIGFRDKSIINDKKREELSFIVGTLVFSFHEEQIEKSKIRKQSIREKS